jgi:hypothetical protein
MTAALLLAAALPAMAEKLAADTPMASTGGATFKAPAGWDVTRGANVVTLATPEGDSWSPTATASAC